MKKILASKEYVNITIEEKINNLSASGFSGSWNDLTDKPFGEESVSSRNTVYEKTIDNTDGKLTYNILSYNIAPLNNRNVVVTVNGVEYESVCTFSVSSGGYSIKLGDGVHYISQSVTVNNASLTKLEAAIYEVKIETIETAETIVPLDEKFIPDTIARVSDSIPTPLTAQVGQTIVVKAVDENGKPTEWECINLPTDEHINALIDAKLADFALPSAEEVAF